MSVALLLPKCWCHQSTERNLEQHWCQTKKKSAVGLGVICSLSNNWFLMQRMLLHIWYMPPLWRMHWWKYIFLFSWVVQILIIYIIDENNKVTYWHKILLVFGIQCCVLCYSVWVKDSNRNSDENNTFGN